MELADVDGPASLAVRTVRSRARARRSTPLTVPAVIVGYVLPVLGDRLSIETVLGVPFTVKFRATGTLADMSIAPTALGIPTGVPPLGSELGEAEAAPPVVTARLPARRPRPGAAVRRRGRSACSSRTTRT